MRVFVVQILFVLSQVVAWASPVADSLRVSLLTCSPGKEIFELYGHTALRITNLTAAANPATMDNRTNDLVFNFGVFSFNQPHFIARFIKGDTDYTMDAVPFDAFLTGYLPNGRHVEEQVLNLNQAEAHRLLQALQDLWMQDNWSYRYNFFKDNCTTRARDIIEQSIGGQIIYAQPKSETPVSYRQIIHEYTQESPWDEIGQDVLLGAAADKPINHREQQFVPYHLKNAFTSATIQRADGSRQPLVLQEQQYTPDVAAAPATKHISPTAVAIIWLLITAAIVFLRWKKKDPGYLWLYDALPLLLQGCMGVIIAYLFLFSSHPTVDSNWLLVFLNPIPLVYLPMELIRARKRQHDYYHEAATIVLLLFCLLAGLIPQDFPTAIILLAWNLLILSAGHLILHRIFKKQSYK